MRDNRVSAEKSMVNIHDSAADSELQQDLKQLIPS